MLFIILFLAPIAVYATFFDTEISTNNIFTADTLDITFRTNNGTNLDLDSSNLNYNISTTLKNIGNLPNINNQRYVYVSGDEQLASKINLTVNIGSTSIYGGLLKDYTLGNLHLAKDESMDILYGISISTEDLGNTNGETLTFKIQDIANQQGLIYPKGFNDVESIQFTLTTPIQSIGTQQTEPIVTNIVDLILGESKLTFPENEKSI